MVLFDLAVGFYLDYAFIAIDYVSQENAGQVLEAKTIRTPVGLLLF